MRMKKIAIFLTALSLVVASVFSFTASAIIYQHPNQTIESDREIYNLVFEGIDTSKTWSYSYDISSSKAVFGDLADGIIGVSKGGAFSADKAITSAYKRNSKTYTVHVIAQSTVNNSVYNAIEDSGYDSCAATSTGKLWVSIAPWFHNCATTTQNNNLTYIWH